MKCLRPAAVLFGFLGLFLPARADLVSVSLAAGVFVPRMKEVRDIYGSMIPAAFSVTWAKTSGLGFSLGVEYINTSGETISSGEERLPLRFRMWTIPATINYGRDLGWIRVSSGLGASFNAYRETWETEGFKDLSAEGGRLGFFAQIAAEVPFSTKLAAVALARYGTVSTNKKAFSGNSVNLGGANLRIGLSYSFAADIAVRVNDQRRRSHER